MIAFIVFAVTLGMELPTTEVIHARQLESGPARVLGDIRNPDYVGSIGGSSRLLLKITKRGRGGRPVRGEFQVKRVTLTCEGDISQTNHYSPFDVLFSSKRAFRGFEYSAQETGYRYFTAVRGHLSRSGAKASGSVLVEDNPSSAPGGRYCFFRGGWAPWRAEARSNRSTR